MKKYELKTIKFNSLGAGRNNDRSPDEAGIETTGVAELVRRGQ